jgi:hypothetical protein
MTYMEPRRGLNLRFGVIWRRIYRQFFFATPSACGMRELFLFDSLVVALLPFIAALFAATDPLMELSADATPLGITCMYRSVVLGARIYWRSP